MYLINIFTYTLHLSDLGSPYTSLTGEFNGGCCNNVLQFSVIRKPLEFAEELADAGLPVETITSCLTSKKQTSGNRLLNGLLTIGFGAVLFIMKNWNVTLK